jgi:hypothetical protein
MQVTTVADAAELQQHIQLRVLFRKGQALSILPPGGFSDDSALKQPCLPVLYPDNLDGDTTTYPIPEQIVHLPRLDDGSAVKLDKHVPCIQPRF